MNTIEIKVKNCRKCPFSTVENVGYDQLWYNCIAPVQIHKGKYDIKAYYKSHKRPKWCPLDDKELIIKTE